MKYAWIKEHKMNFNICLMCQICKVDKSSYYHWVRNGAVVHKVDEKLEGFTFPVPKNPQHYLSEIYSFNFMELPPKEKRTIHAWEIIVK